MNRLPVMRKILVQFVVGVARDNKGGKRTPSSFASSTTEPPPRVNDGIFR